MNTDFAETEVDTRRTNLTRFPLFFPEKRTFFLEGSDIFSFGLGLNQGCPAYFSRRIGLVADDEVPIIAGGKLNGRAGQTNFGGLAVGTNDRAGVVPDQAFMAVGRAKQNLWHESWIGGIATVGDPLGRSGSWLGGADFTYATSRFRGDKNFLVGIWGLATGSRGAGGDRTAHGLKIDYPNDLWDIALTYKRIGRDFDPSLGFVPRRAVQLINGQVDNLRDRAWTAPADCSTSSSHCSRPTCTGQWESYDVIFTRRSTGGSAAATVRVRRRSRPANDWSNPPRSGRSVDSARRVPVAPLPSRGGHGAETPPVRGGRLVVRAASTTAGSIR